MKILPREFTLRPYEPRDREAVRQICCETADSGEPMDGWFPDREIFADLLMRYYTDCEPESLLVAMSDGRVVGYLAACRDTARFRRMMAFWIVPATVLKAMLRGTLWHPKLRALLWANRHIGQWRDHVSVDAYPAHLHINLRHNYRGLHIGQRLLDQWLRQARAAEIRGVHAAVNASNTRGARFFKAMGFQPLGRQLCLHLPRRGRTIETIIYALPLR